MMICAPLLMVIFPVPMNPFSSVCVISFELAPSVLRVPVDPGAKPLNVIPVAVSVAPFEITVLPKPLCPLEKASVVRLELLPSMNREPCEF